MIIHTAKAFKKMDLKALLLLALLQRVSSEAEQLTIGKFNLIGEAYLEKVKEAIRYCCVEYLYRNVELLQSC